MISSKPKPAKTPVIGLSSRQQQALLRRQRFNASRFNLWVDWKIPSGNRNRGKHWAKIRLQNIAAKNAWLSSLKSSPSEVDRLMMIISALAPNLCETLLRTASVSMTGISGCAGVTIQPLAKAPPGALSESKGSNEGH